MNALQAMEKFVQERLQLFINKMREFSRTGEQINLGKWCHFFAFDVIGELVCDRSPGLLLCTRDSADVGMRRLSAKASAC